MKRLIFITITVAVMGIIFFITRISSSAAPNLTGTVTLYSPGPSPVDVPAQFEVDGEEVYVGGNMLDPMAESFDMDIQTGDKIEAYVIEDEGGRKTIVGCDECYIRKAK